MAERTRARRVTAADVARSLGLSRATVGFVLNDTPGQTISEATRERVLAEAARLGYRPHAAAQALARGRSNIVLLVLPDWPLDYSLRRHLEEVDSELDRAGFMVATQVRHREGRAQPLWRTLDPDVVVGITPLSEEERADIRASGITRIVPDPDAAGAAASFAAIDRGPRLQVRYLAERGRKRLGIATTTDPRVAGLQEQRLATAFAAAREVGLTDPIPIPVELPGGSAGTTAAEAVSTWRAAGVTGVLGYNDDVAAAVLGGALRAGLAVPRDLAVVGHDDSPLASLMVPGLTSVRLDTAGLGRYVAQLAINAAQDRDTSVELPRVAVEVIEREST